MVLLNSVQRCVLTQIMKLNNVFDSLWPGEKQVSMLQSDSDAEHTAIAAPITGSIPYSLHSLLVNNPLTDTDRWLTRPFHCILCLQSVGNVG